MTELVIFDGLELFDYDVQKEFVEDFCESNDLDVPQEGSSGWNEIIDIMFEDAYERLKEDIKEMDRALSASALVFVSGFIEPRYARLRDGKLWIDSVENQFYSIEEAFVKCAENTDLANIRMVLSDDRKSIKLKCGLARGEIFLLSYDVIDEIEDNEDGDKSVPPRSEWVTIKW